MKKLYFILFILVGPILMFSQNTASFTQVGPIMFPSNPSVQTTGMGRVCHLVYHPTDSNIMFAVSASGGVFKSINEGTSWRPISDYLPQTACATLAINPLNPNVMYLGTGDANYNAAGLGVWKSNNAGKNWFQSTTGMGNKLVSNIIFTPNDTSTLIAACSDGIYKSTNAGSTWVKKTTVSSSYRDLTYRPKSNTILYSATNTFFYRSYDNGNTWIQSNLNAAITCAGIKIAVCPSDTSKLYCIVWKTGGSSPFGGIYKSINNGSSFTLQSDTPNVLGYSSNGSSLDGQGSYNLCIVADPLNANIIYTGGITVWKSINQGAALTLKSPWAFGVHADKHGFLFSPYNNSKLFIYHDGGIDRTTDGGNTWKTLQDGLSASEFYKMGNSGLYNDYIIGGLQDNGLDVAVDKKFYTVRGGDWGSDFVFDAFDPKTLYENGGLKRNIISFGTSNINSHGGIYCVHPKDSNVMFGADDTLFRTKNIRAIPTSNVAWSQILTIAGNPACNSMAYSKASYGTFYIVFNNQSLYRSININSTSPSFTKVTTFTFNSGEQIKQLETCDYDSNILYVLTTQSRLLKSADKGATWVSIKKNLPTSTLIKFLLDQKSTDSSMYACTAFGVYYRNQNMGNWINYSQGLPSVAQISDMEIMSDGTTNGRLHISFYGRGIWQTNLCKNIAMPAIADFVIHPSTSQNCPNTVFLVDNSTYSPTSRKWQIKPTTGWSYLSGTDSLSARAEIQFNASGVYYISLTVTNSLGSDIKTLTYSYSILSTSATCTTSTNLLGGYSIGIYKFEFNTINKSSNTGNSSYEDFSCSNNTIVKANTTYTAWVTNGTNYAENAKIYIDYNNNGLFTDANELVGTISSGLGRRSCPVSILASPPQANKYIRMRVVSDYGAVTSPCGTLSYGQSEDYAIWIDNIKPTVSISIPKPSVSSSFVATFKTSEVVYGFAASDVIVSNGTLSNFVQTDALTYTAKITPINNGLVKIDIVSNAFTDLAGNSNNTISNTTLFFLGIKTFSFNGISVKDSIIQTLTGGSITCNVPYGTVLDSLKATFTLSDSSKAYIGSTLQTSGLTKNNFKTVITYIIKSNDNSVSKTYTVTLIVNKNSDCKLLTFGFVNPLVSGIVTQNSTGGTVIATVPFGTVVTNLKASFTLSDSAKAYIKFVKQISTITSNNFSTQLIYKIIAQDTNYSKTYQVTVKFGKSKSCDMLNYSIQTPSATGIIVPVGTTGGTISVKLPYGTPLNNLIALFTVSDSASVYIGSIKQLSKISINDFSTSLTYKVVAQDTNYSKTYQVNIKYDKNKACDLLSFAIKTPSASGVIVPIGSTGGNATIILPFGTSLNNLTALFTVSDSASVYIGSIKQQSGFTTNNFISTVLYKVVAQDTNFSKIYSIKVLIEPNDAADLLSYNILTPAATGIISPTTSGGIVNIDYSFSANISNLVAQFTISDSAKAYVNGILQQSSTTHNNYADTLVFTVKAQNNVNTKTYLITVRTTNSIVIIKNDKLKIYPNPASKELRISFDQSQRANTEFKIVNILGSVVIESKLRDVETIVDISNLENGIYYLQLLTDDGFVIGKFIKE